MDLARLLGWRCYHPWLSARSTPGFPDLVLVRPPRILFVELKTERGKVTPAQQAWLDALAACPGCEVDLWRPRDLDAAAATLR